MNNNQINSINESAKSSSMATLTKARNASDARFEMQVEIRDLYLRNGFDLATANERSAHEVQIHFA